MEFSDQQQNQDPSVRTHDIFSVTEMEHSHLQQYQDPRMGHLEEQLRQTSLDLEQKQEEVKSLSQSMREMEEELHQTRLDLKQREEEVESLKQRMKRMEEKARSTLEQKQEEVASLSNRMKQMKEELRQTRLDLKHKEEEVESLYHRMREMEKELYWTRYDLKEREEEVESLKHRMREMEGQLRQTRSVLKEREEEVKSFSNRMKQMKEELRQTRFDLKEKDKELQSFKDRVAVDVTLSMKTGNKFESMNSPVSRSRLKDMYEDLRTDWPKIKKHLKSNGESPEFVKEMIQEKFRFAILDMERKKQQIDEVFGLDEASRGSASEKVQQYRESTRQNLQLVLYHRRKEDADLKTPSSGHEGGKPQDVMKSWSSYCYRLGCLMALNNPPLHPDWENHPRSMDKWDFFPRNLTAASGK